MATIGQMQFPILTPEQANPFLTGFSGIQEALYKQAQSRYVDEERAKQQILNQYLPQREQNAVQEGQLKNKWYEPDKRSEIGLRGAQSNYYNTKSTFTPYEVGANYDSVTKLLLGQQLMQRMIGQQNPNNGSAPMPTSAPANALQRPELGNIMSFLQANNANALPAQASAGNPESTLAAQLSDPNFINRLYAEQINNLTGGLLKDPKTGNARGGAGSVYTDPNTGERRSSETMENTTNDQRVLSAVRRVEPQIQKIIDTLPNWQGYIAQGVLAAENTINKVLPRSFKGFQGPSNYAAGQANLKSSAEGLLKAYGLNGTSEAIQTMVDTMKPLSGESKYWYRERLLNKLEELRHLQEISADNLNQGYLVNAPQTSSQNISQEDIAHTAKKYGVSEEEVRRKLGL